MSLYHRAHTFLPEAQVQKEARTKALLTLVPVAWVQGMWKSRSYHPKSDLQGLELGKVDAAPSTYNDHNWGQV